MLSLRHQCLRMVEQILLLPVQWQRLANWLVSAELLGSTETDVDKLVFCKFPIVKHVTASTKCGEYCTLALLGFSPPPASWRCFPQAVASAACKESMCNMSGSKPTMLRCKPNTVMAAT